MRGFKEILEGKHDSLPEQAFYMVGDIDAAVAPPADGAAVAERARRSEGAGRGCRAQGRSRDGDVRLASDLRAAPPCDPMRDWE